MFLVSLSLSGTPVAALRRYRCGYRCGYSRLRLKLRVIAAPLVMARLIVLAAAVASPPSKPWASGPGDDYVMRLAFASPPRITPDPKPPVYAELPPNTLRAGGPGDPRGGGGDGDDDADEDDGYYRTVRREGYAIEFRGRGFAHLSQPGAGGSSLARAPDAARPGARSTASTHKPPGATRAGGAAPQSRRLRRGRAGWTPPSKETADVVW